jgi:hypothetical protein
MADAFFRMATPAGGGGAYLAVSLTRGDRAARPRSANVPLSRRGTAGGDSPGGGTVCGWWGQRVRWIRRRLLGRAGGNTVGFFDVGRGSRDHGRTFRVRRCGRRDGRPHRGSRGARVERVSGAGARLDSARQPAARPFVPF